MNSRLEWKDRRNRELEDITIEITKAERWRENILGKKHNSSFRDLWEYRKLQQSCQGNPRRRVEKRERKREREGEAEGKRYITVVIVENFFKFDKRYMLTD